MITTVILEDSVAIPLVSSLSDFRRWAQSDSFPEFGRIDYVAGHIEVDMSPESLFSHGALKVEIARVLATHVKQRDSGHVFTDRTRISCPGANLSSEPDVIVLLHQSIDEGRVRLVPKATGSQWDFIEIEGPPDLVVEIVSDSSVGKDTQRLPSVYFVAGVQEYWLVDARREELTFNIHHRGAACFVATSTDAESFQHSVVLKGRFRIDRNRNRRGHWVYHLMQK